MYYVLMTLLIFVAFLLILLILIQKGRGGGLSSAFGGGGGSAAFGAKTGDVLTWLTSGFFAFFILLAVILDLLVNSQYKLTVPLPPKGAAAIASPAAATPDVPVTPMDQTPPPTIAPAPATAPATSNPGLATPIAPNQGLPNPAAQLGNALDKKIQSATSAAVPKVNAATQKASTGAQKLLNAAKPTTQPK